MRAAPGCERKISGNLRTHIYFYIAMAETYKYEQVVGQVIVILSYCLVLKKFNKIVGTSLRLKNSR